MACTSATRTPSSSKQPQRTVCAGDVAIQDVAPCVVRSLCLGGTDRSLVGWISASAALDPGRLRHQRIVSATPAPARPARSTARRSSRVDYPRTGREPTSCGFAAGEYQDKSVRTDTQGHSPRVPAGRWAAHWSAIRPARLRSGSGRWLLPRVESRTLRTGQGHVRRPLRTRRGRTGRPCPSMHVRRSLRRRACPQAGES